jgi:hypothetical protein
MAGKQLNRIVFSVATFGIAASMVCAASATARVYSFKPARTKHGAIVFMITSVRPEAVRSARIRIGRRPAERVNLSRARRAARRHRLQVRPNATSAPRLLRRGTLRIVADTTPPDTTIVSGPSGDVTSRSASFEFVSSEDGSRFQCRLDAGGWKRCRSPKSYSRLTLGPHTVLVRARDGAGNLDPTPASDSWTIVSSEPAPSEPAPSEPAPEPEPEPTPAPSEPLPAGALMYDGFEAANGPNNLITNEYAAWHSWDTSAVASAVWQSDGGSLFSVPTTGEDGEATRAAYTGRLDNNAADKYSETWTHSDKMRFWTKASGFEDVRVDADIKPIGWGAEAPSTWAGFKFYLRREYGVTESPFYTAEPYIKDGHAYIQKKCLGDTGGGNYSSGGTYYLLASKSSLGTPLGSWHKISATTQTNADGSVTISLYRDGTLTLQAVDRGVRSDGTGCPPLTGGHIGFRSDYFEYYLDNYEVTPLR